MYEGNALEFLAYKINKMKLTVCFGLYLLVAVSGQGKFVTLKKFEVHLFRNTVFTKMQDEAIFVKFGM